MQLVIVKFAIPLAIAALLGLLVGWSTCAAPVRKNGWGWARYGIAAFVAGLLVAGLALMPGRPGLGLETGLLMFATYIAGCSFGCFLHNLSIGQTNVESLTGPSHSYTMRVAGIGTVPDPTKAETVPLTSLPYLAGATSRTMALNSSATGYTMAVAGINTTAAEAIARLRAPSIEREAEVRRLRAARLDTMGLAVACINTLAGRSGVRDLLERTTQQALHSVSSTEKWKQPVHVANSAPDHGNGKPTRDTMALAVAAINTIADRSGVSDLFEPSRRQPAADPVSSQLEVAGSSTLDSGATSSQPTLEQPPLMPEPRNGQKDDLTLIWGVAETLEIKLNGMGIWHYEQIALWGPAHVQWFEATVEGFKGRIERDKWIEQCAKLHEGWRPDKAAGERSKH